MVWILDVFTITYRHHPSPFFGASAIRIPWFCIITFSMLRHLLALSYCWVVPRPLSSESALELLETHIFPTHQYTERSNFNRYDVLAQSSSSRILAANDPQLQFTYGEFPLTSLDLLLDHAVLYLQQQQQQQPTNIPPPRYTVLDVGSGCGRPALYMALTRSFQRVWGIEASERLHQEGLRALQQAADGEYLLLVEEEEEESSDKNKGDPTTITTITNNHPSSSSLTTEIHLFQGLAQDYAHLLAHADIIFCYSTAFDSNGVFLPDVGGMVLADEWNLLFSQNCRPGTLVITTDRCLNLSAQQWKLIQRLDSVPNPPVLDSTCFLQQKL